MFDIFLHSGIALSVSAEDITDQPQSVQRVAKRFYMSLIPTTKGSQLSSERRFFRTV